MNKRKTTLASGYTNFTIPADNEAISELTYDGTLDADAFYHEYIATRRPVKLTNYFPPISKQSAPGLINLADFSPKNIVDTLDYDQELQIEKKFQHGFGSGQQRVKMTLDKLMQLFNEGHDEYYLTTQYDFDEPEKDDEDEDEDDEDEESEDEENEIEDDEEDEDEREEGNENDNSKDSNVDSDSDDNTKDNFDSAHHFHALDTSNFSDTSSIDMNNLHDDFVDSDEEDPIVDEESSLTQSEAFLRVKELLQPPLTKLDDKLPIIPELFSKLIPQQINLWMGATKPHNNQFALDPKDPKMGLGKYVPGTNCGSSSGLHHDHADNLYILASGSKRFTLFLPADALKMYTVGTICKIFNSGIIDYEVNSQAPHWKHIRDDGAIIEEIINWKLAQIPDSTEEARLLKQLDAEVKERKQATVASSTKAKLDPPNFSTIPPALLHIEDFEDETTRRQLVKFAEKHFPGFLGLRRYTVWLEPGDMLYLPAGWFHEVTSFGSTHNAGPDMSPVHVALNYWFVPPNANPYGDGYWHEDWNKTRKSLRYVRSS